MTAAQLIALSRITLKDEAGSRFFDAELLAYLNSGLNQLKLARPDEFVGSGFATEFALGLSDSLPLGVAYQDKLADFVAGSAELGSGATARAVVLLNRSGIAPQASLPPA